MVSSADSEQCSLQLLFNLEKVRSEAALLCGISREVFMTTDTISVRVMQRTSSRP